MHTIQATIMQTPERDRLEILHDVVLEITSDGTIAAITPATSFQDSVDHTLAPDAVLLPGLIDLHIHAPQWPQLGTGLDIGLEQWLTDYTFPLEARFSDLSFAEEVWHDLVSTLIAHGTTTAVYFATQDLDATTLLAKTCAELGQRAYVGRVAMDHPQGTPSWYRDSSAEAGIEDSLASIEQIQAVGSGGLVQPIITPRFIPACTDDLLNGLGELCAQTGVRVQTHCSESDWEHHYVLDRYGMSDTQALQRFGLLEPRTVLAHSDHVSDDDLALIRSTQAGIAHCPLSNAYFANAVFPVAHALNEGVRVGLGSDIAGGSEPGLLAQCAHAVTASRHLEDGVNPRLTPNNRGGLASSRIDILMSFWLATVGGAAVLDRPLGLLKPGHHFDAIAIDPNLSPRTPLRRWDVDDDLRWFEKVVRLARPADIAQVWVGGQPKLSNT